MSEQWRACRTGWETAGFMPRDHPNAVIKTIGICRTLGIPNIIYAVALSEKVPYLSGIRTNSVIMAILRFPAA